MTSRSIWFAIAIVCTGLVIASFVMTQQLNLHPCHLCILQRLLFMLLAAFALLAGFAPRSLFGRLTGALALLATATGIGVAGYQVWLQAQPVDPFSCTSGTPELVERMVDWLGQKAPDLFLATGLCQEVEWSFMKVSFAGWALIAFAIALLAGLAALRGAFRQPR